MPLEYYLLSLFHLQWGEQANKEGPLQDAVNKILHKKEKVHKEKYQQTELIMVQSVYMRHEQVPKI